VAFNMFSGTVIGGGPGIPTINEMLLQPPNPTNKSVMVFTPGF